MPSPCAQTSEVILTIDSLPASIIVPRGLLVLPSDDTSVSEGIVQAFLDAGTIVDASELLVAVGRTPETSMIGPEQAGVRLSGRGFIAVDEDVRSSAERAWASREPTETKAPEAGRNVRIARGPVTAIARVRTNGHHEGEQGDYRVPDQRGWFEATVHASLP